MRVRKSPADFAEIVSNGTYQRPWHVELLNKHLMDVYTGKTKRLRISLPPRHSKSESVSKYFAAWFLMMKPEERVMLTSYEADFAASWGRKARDLVEEHGHFFDVKVNKRSSASNRWDIENHNGGMVTAGVGGAITGKGASIAIVDDPVKNAEDARSKIMQDKIWDWFTSTMYTRLEPGGAIIIIQTRWSDIDLSGRIMEQEESIDPELRDPFPWVHLNLPAIAEWDEPPYRKKGEALWPERFDEQALQSIKNNISPYWWASLYQGSPTPDDGMVYRKQGERLWYQGDGCYRLKQADNSYRDILTDKCWNFITVDLAVSEKQSADFTVMSVWAATPTKDLILLDCVRSHMTAPEKIPTMQKLKDRYQASYLAIEKFGYQLETVQNARFAGLPVHEVAPKGDKVAKSWEAAAKWESGQIYMPGNAGFKDELLMELYAFPNGKHDDFADTLAIAAIELSRSGDPMEAMGVVICHRCQNKFVRNQRTGYNRPCTRCGAPPATPQLTEELEPTNEPNALS